jgi:hypothetical protein
LPDILNRNDLIWHFLRCPKGNAAEAVATRLDKKLRENLRDARNSLFVSDGLQVIKDPDEFNSLKFFQPEHNISR